MPTRMARAVLPLAIIVAAIGCASPATEADESEDALRADPNALVLTQDPSVRLLGSYNAFLDRAPTTGCVADQPAVNVGDVRGEFYLRHVTSKEELAKELEVDIGASLKLPRGSVDASTKLVTSFKRSSTTASFVVRAVRSYAVTSRGSLALTDPALALLQQGNVPKFIQTCGGSFIKSVRYEAQVVALMQFDAQTEEAAKNIQNTISGGVNGIPRLASASAELKTKSAETAKKNNASLSVTVAATGFLTREGRSVASVVENTFEKIDELRADMNASFDTDLQHDRDGYFANSSRNARPSQAIQASYSQLSNAPANAPYTHITGTLARAEEFFNDVAQHQVRMESVYTDEIERFLTDTRRWGGNQFRYNILPNPKISTTAIVPVVQEYAAKFRPSGTPQPEGTLVLPLRMAIERCLAGAANGDYRACETDPIIERAKNEATFALGEYTDKARIVPLVAWMPTLGATMSYRNAEADCRQKEMRLPKRAEMRLIAPVVTALAGPSGAVWFAGDAECAKPVFTNNVGQASFTCGDTWNEGLPYVADLPVVCVGLNGPVAAMPRP
jgi:hypothetical protein